MLIEASHGLEWFVENGIKTDFHLIVLSLPFLALITALQRIGKAQQAPIIAICECTTDDQRIELHKAGATIILDRAYNPRLLLAQASALSLGWRNNSVSPLAKHTIQVAGLKVNSQSRSVLLPSDKTVSLTVKEFDLLTIFLRYPGQTLASEQIIEAVWGYTGIGSKNALRNLISRLRNKIETVPADPQLIRSVVNVGYLLSASV